MKGRTKVYATATALVLAGSAYFLHSVFAVQGQGTLAQQPLNVQAQIPPAFIMAVDDSGSMTFETLLPGQDGQGCWNTANPTGFFNANGTLRTSGTCGYNHLIPYTGHRIDGNRHAIPPIPTFGFARSHEFNPSYFNPGESYLPWLNSDGTPYGATVMNPLGNALPTATRANPRSDSVVLNLTVDQIEDDANSRFRLLSGMELPFGTEYYATAGCGNGNNVVGGTGNRRDRWITVSAANSGAVTGTCTVGIRYFPATFYLSVSTPAPAGYRTNLVLPGLFGGRRRIADACGDGCDMYQYEIRSANYSTADSYNAAIQNFANWFSFYGNRNRAMVAGMTRSLSDIQNMRVGYFRINSRTANVAMHNMNSPTEKTLLYKDLLALPASGGTPNLFAVEHMGKQFQRINAGAPIQLACQKNAGMLFTDGYSNGGSPGADAVTGLGKPFDATPANSMAAIATQYYQTTLRTGTNFPLGRVPLPSGCSTPNPDPRLDCNANLHMNFYGVTLGATGSIYDPDVDRDPFVAPFPNWTGHTNDSPTTVDDIWHASINTRGEFINARTPNDITAAMRRVLASVSAGSSPAGSIALTGARIGEGSLSVSPFYEARNNGTDWYSTLTAQSVTSSPTTGVVSFANAWEASARLPAAASRNHIWYGTGNGAQLFNVANVGSLAKLCDNNVPGMSLCSPTTLAALGGAANTLTVTEAVNYLKGDQALEAERNVNGKLRFRTTRLGDIVNSTPVVSAPTDDYGYRSLSAPYGASYATYVASKIEDGDANLRRPMVYAGANDGMLHGFDGRTTANGGVERFGFIPQTVLGYMGNLLFPYDQAASGDQRFQHRYYVDGPLTVSDAYYGAGAAAGWKTVLAGSTGAGAKGVFALNVSGVSRPTGSFAAADRLWEVSALNASLTQAERDNIGHVLGRPVIVPVKTGTGAGPVKWRAIFGNGYNSASGKAVLYLVDIGTGAPQITMIEAIESGAPAGSNGLGNIVVLDRFTAAADGTLTLSGRDGFADTAYAADQKGAIWKFDLRSASPAAPTRPLFTSLPYTTGAEANTRQPILGGLTASAGRNGGVMLYFGTGSFSFEGDPVDTTRQSLYGVLDNGGAQPTATLTRAGLQAQAVSTTANDIRTTTSNQPGAGSRGWYIDLPERERFVGYPRIENGVVFMPTYAPVSSLQCSVAGVNWLYGLNALTGGAGLSSVTFNSPQGSSPGAGTGAISLATQGTAPVKDVAIFSSPRLAPLASGATSAELEAALAAQCSMVVQVAGAPTMYLKRPCGRQSWRQIQ